MWRDAVKVTLQEERERRRREAENRADFVHTDVEIVSVSRLLQLLYDGASRSELREHWGIESYDTSSRDAKPSRSLKRSRVEIGEPIGLLGAKAFTSQSVWITGFLRYEPHQTKPRTAPRMCLCDANNRIPVHLIEPRLELLDALVLVKHWTVVTQGPTDVLTPHGSLEAHGDPLVLHSATGPQISIEDALKHMRLHFPAADPPMYIGTRPWAQPAAVNGAPISEKQKKRKFHVVYGRVASVSPIALQGDAADSHFFVEVENWEEGDHGRVKSLVNVLVAGHAALRWHQFVWPGLLIMMTNLKKVYYSECEMFLLQAVVAEGSNADGVDAATSLFVWQPDARTPELPPVMHQLQIGRNPVVDLEGIVESIMWEECLVLRGEPSTIVTLFHYPWSEIKAHIRVGSHVRVNQAHVLSPSRPGHERSLLGLCPRSHLSIIRHAPADSPLLASTRLAADQRRRLLKKWSQFGDFSKQPLAISMWWLHLLEVLVQKFRFSSDADESSSEAEDITFACLRRREATLHIGRELLSAIGSQSSSSSTLARHFLTSHNPNSQDCPSMGMFDDAAYLAKCVVTVEELRRLINRIATARIEQASALGQRLAWPLHLDGSEFSNIAAVGALRGFVDSNDVELADCTGRIPVVIERSSGFEGVKTEPGCSVYALMRYSVIVELSSQTPAHDSTSSSYIVSLTASVNDLQRVRLCSSFHGDSDGSLQKASRSSVYVFITEIGPWKRHRRMVGRVNEFRHVRGIGFRQQSSDNTTPDWSSAHCVEVLVSSTSECWFLKRYAWYSLSDVAVYQSAPGTSKESRLAQWFSLMIAPPTNDTDGKYEATIHSFEEQAQTRWIEAAETADSVSTATYLVDRASIATSVAFPHSTITKAGRLVQASQVLHVNSSIRRCLEALENRVRSTAKIYSVRELFQHQRRAEATEAVGRTSIESDPHTARLINLIGIVSERVLYQRVPRHSTIPGELPATVSTRARSARMCRFKIRDRATLEAVAITVDEDAFGTLSALQPGSLVEFSKLQCFLARNTFKPFITWTHCTTAHLVCDDSHVHLSDAQIFTRMPTTHLHALYRSENIDRSIKRFVVRLVHISYVVLKRRCSQCKQPLTLVKRQRMWVHAADMADESSVEKASHKCSWRQLAQDSPVFSQQTTLSCSMRGIVDDGSAQSELFLENDVVWELLQCSAGQRRRFEELLHRQTSELSYFATRSAVDSLFTSPSAQENAYYQNDWRGFVQDTVSSMSSIVVYAQRFYKNQATKETPQTAVLSFGKDIQIATPSAPLAQLEAVRVDMLTARYELRRRLALVATQHS